jgi:hypothetical protein
MSRRCANDFTAHPFIFTATQIIVLVVSGQHRVLGKCADYFCLIASESSGERVGRTAHSRATISHRCATASTTAAHRNPGKDKRKTGDGGGTFVVIACP